MQLLSSEKTPSLIFRIRLLFVIGGEQTARFWNTEIENNPVSMLGQLDFNWDLRLHDITLPHKTYIFNRWPTHILLSPTNTKLETMRAACRLRWGSAASCRLAASLYKVGSLAAVAAGKLPTAYTASDHISTHLLGCRIVYCCKKQNITVNYDTLQYGGTSYSILLHFYVR